MYPVVHLEDELSATSSASSSPKTQWGSWGCRGRPPGHLFLGQFRKKKLSDLIFSFFYFLSFFQQPFLLHPLQKQEGVDNVLCRGRPPWHLFWGNFEKLEEKKFCPFFFLFFFTLKFFDFYKYKIKDWCDEKKLLWLSAYLNRVKTFPR